MRAKFAKEVARYLKIEQMVELKKGQNYEVYNNITTDPFNWKRLNSTTTTNNYAMQEIKFNISDSALLGSEDSFYPTEVILNKYRVVFDKQVMVENFLRSCQF